MPRILDIHSDHPYPSCELSNFAPHYFVFDNVFCASMEGLIQAFKFSDPEVQKKVCGLEGIIAKKRGRQMNLVWKGLQVVWWYGVEMPRESQEYQLLLNRAYTALFHQVTRFRKALVDSRDSILRHSIGSNDPEHTVLTEEEFTSRLTALRLFAQKLEKGKSHMDNPLAMSL